MAAPTEEPARDVTGPVIGRFAPSPTGPLHAGSLVAALASWLDVRARGGRWLVRLEDVDTPRCVAGADQRILSQLAGCGLCPDEPPVWQSTRGHAYALALAALRAQGHAYDCGCSRRDIERAQATRGLVHRPGQERPYPGTCRDGLHGQPARAVRLRSTDADGAPVVIEWHDRRLGALRQDVTAAVGDFVLHRADGLWAYQLAVVVDDAAQGITHIVRGEDLADNTARQILLQRRLGLATPRYLHTPLVRTADGEKLSKATGAPAVEPGLVAVRAALGVLDLPVAADSLGDLLAAATRAWAARWHDAAPGPSTARGSP